MSSSRKSSKLKAPAKKFDAGKPSLSLLDNAALLEMARVLDFGAEVYDRYNWRKGMQWSRLIDASLRHINAFNDGEDLAEDSQLNHLAHAAVCLTFLLRYHKDRNGTDDRFKR